jgi:YidC/Oxa1 family membrane protein insertase
MGHLLDGEKKGIQKVDGALAIPGTALNQGDSVTQQLRIYGGPREYRRLRLLDNREKDVLDYGSFLGLPTGPFSRLLLNSMNFLYSWTGSYFLAIILLTIIVKAILWPLQSKANRSMKKMSALQPEMKRLQEKYKEEPVKFQQEMGKVWKKAGVNPLSGCWPIFIQIPIFIGFYNMLGKAVELRHHGFLWVKDLSQPDTVGHILGLPINPLPLIMAGTMLLQMLLTPQTGDAAQRRMFMFMPLIFIFMCYNFASALALYWTVQNIISIVQLKLGQDKNAAQPVAALAK